MMIDHGDHDCHNDPYDHDDQAWKFCIFWERRSEPKKIQEPKKTKKKEMKRGERERKEKRGERE